MTMTIADALTDLRDRAVREKDAVAYATIVEVQKHFPTAAATQPVPDLRTHAPFRASDPEALRADGRGLNRTG